MLLSSPSVRESRKMAESSICVAQDQFCCPVCLDLLKDPVSIPCGHSYCMSCISGCWDQEDEKRVYSCPQCRHAFSPRPALHRNTMMTELVEKLKETKLGAAGPAQHFSGSGDVECDVCTGDKNRAVKSCLTCLNSYCQTHFECHEEINPGQRHRVTEATGRLQEMICPLHDRLLEIFCRTDQSCICYLCTMDEHRNHDTVSAEREKTDKQKALEETQMNFQQRIQERQKELEELRAAVETHKRSAQAAVSDTERIFTQLIRSIERSRSEVTQMIRNREAAAVSRAEEQLERLKQEMEDLRRRDAELEQLSHTHHHTHFLQSFLSLSVPPGSTDSSSVTISSRLTFDDVGESVSRLRDKLEQIWREEKEMISARVRDINIIPTPEPKTREDFLQYFHQFSLDPNTLHNYLGLSEGNRRVERVDKVHSYPDHPDRFDRWRQVLCRESVCERSYWELEWSGHVYISVSYKSISRKGKDGTFGRNDQSWCLSCTPNSFSFCHNNIKTKLPESPRSSRIGVYVDHRAGTLSFYSVSDTMSLIHSVQTTFTQSLCPGFWIKYLNSKVTICDLTK